MPKKKKKKKKTPQKSQGRAGVLRSISTSDGDEDHITDEGQHQHQHQRARRDAASAHGNKSDDQQEQSSHSTAVPAAYGGATVYNCTVQVGADGRWSSRARRPISAAGNCSRTTSRYRNRSRSRWRRPDGDAPWRPRGRLGASWRFRGFCCCCCCCWSWKTEDAEGDEA